MGSKCSKWDIRQAGEAVKVSVGKSGHVKLINKWDKELSRTENHEVLSPSLNQQRLECMGVENVTKQRELETLAK